MLVPVFVLVPGQSTGMPGGPCTGQRPSGRTTWTLALLRHTLAGPGTILGVGVVARDVRSSVIGQARGRVHPFGCARGWLPRGMGGLRAGSGINQTVGRAGGGVAVRVMKNSDQHTLTA